MTVLILLMDVNEGLGDKDRIPTRSSARIKPVTYLGGRAPVTARTSDRVAPFPPTGARPGALGLPTQEHRTGATAQERPPQEVGSTSRVQGVSPPASGVPPDVGLRRWTCEERRAKVPRHTLVPKLVLHEMRFSTR